VSLNMIMSWLKMKLTYVETATLGCAKRVLRYMWKIMKALPRRMKRIIAMFLGVVLLVLAVSTGTFITELAKYRCGMTSKVNITYVVITPSVMIMDVNSPTATFNIQPSSPKHKIPNYNKYSLPKKTSDLL